MIRRRVSAALLALDGFTGEPLGARVIECARIFPSSSLPSMTVR